MHRSVKWRRYYYQKIRKQEKGTEKVQWDTQSVVDFSNACYMCIDIQTIVAPDELIPKHLGSHWAVAKLNQSPVSNVSS